MAINLPETNRKELISAAMAAKKAYDPPDSEQKNNTRGVNLQKLDGHTAPVEHKDGIGFIGYTQTKIDNPNELTINIRGTDEFKDGLADLGLLRTWMESPVFNDLVEVAAEKIKNGGHVRSVGHSAGGAAAEALCYQAVAMAGPSAAGSCTVHNINGPGTKETLEAVIGGLLDPQVTGRIKGVAHRNAKDEVSLFGTHIVPSATYPAPPVFPWAPPAITHHMMDLFLYEIAMPGVRPTSVEFKETPYPTATNLAVKIGPTSTSLLTGELPHAEMAENIVDRVWDKLGNGAFSLFSNQSQLFAREFALDAISRGQPVRDIINEIALDIRNGHAEGYKSGMIAAARAEMAADVAALEQAAKWTAHIEKAPEPTPSPSPTSFITGPVQAALSKAGYVGDPEAIVASYTAALGLGLTREDALDQAYAEARKTAEAADIAALERASKWNAAAKEPEEHFSNLVEEAAKEGTGVLAGLVAGSGKPRAKGPKLATAGDWSKYVIDALPEKPSPSPAPAPVLEKKSAAPSKPVPPEIQARRDAVEAGMRTWGFGGSVEGLKAAERQADAAAAQAKVDARRAEQEKEDAAKRRQEEKAELAAENQRNREVAKEEQIVSKPEMNKPTLGQEPFQKADPAKRPGPPSQTRLGLSGKPPVGEVRHGAKGVVSPASRRTKAPVAGNRGKQMPGGKKSGGYKVTEGYEGGTGGNSSRTDRGDGSGKQHGAEGFVPGNNYEKLSLQPVTSAGGIVRNRYGFAVVTGQKPGLGEYNGGRHGGVDNVSERVVCTELVAQGLLNPGLYFLDVRFTEERLSPACVRGYHVWAVPLVRLMRKSEFVTRLVAPVARWRAEEIAHLLGAKPRGNVAGKLVRLMGEPLCRLIGAFVSETDYQQLYKTETVQ